MGVFGLRLSALCGIVMPFVVYEETGSIWLAVAVAVVGWPIAYFAAKEATVVERRSPPER